MFDSHEVGHRHQTLIGTRWKEVSQRHVSVLPQDWSSPCISTPLWSAACSPSAGRQTDSDRTCCYLENVLICILEVYVALIQIRCSCCWWSFVWSCKLFYNERIICFLSVVSLHNAGKYCHQWRLWFWWAPTLEMSWRLPVWQLSSLPRY